MASKPIPVAIGLGSNLGNRALNLNAAIYHLAQEALQNVNCSSFYNYDPVDCPPNSPRFLNAALTATTQYPAIYLLKVCKKIEKIMGRTQNYGYHENRIIDIDILTFGDLSITTESLTIPHPELTHREFVLRPLSEIAPNWTIKPHGKTITAHLYNLIDQKAISWDDK